MRRTLIIHKMRDWDVSLSPSLSLALSVSLFVSTPLFDPRSPPHPPSRSPSLPVSANYSWSDWGVFPTGLESFFSVINYALARMRDNRWDYGRGSGINMEGRELDSRERKYLIILSYPINMGHTELVSTDVRRPISALTCKIFYKLLFVYDLKKQILMTDINYQEFVQCRKKNMYFSFLGAMFISSNAAWMPR